MWPLIMIIAMFVFLTALFIKSRGFDNLFTNSLPHTAKASRKDSVVTK